MNERLRELLAEISLGKPLCHERIELIPLRLGRKSDLDYLVFDETLAATDVLLEEVSAAGSVPTLRVRNHAKHRVFLPDGTMLVGCKQNRVVNLSIMIAPESETVIPVSCVERGRWNSATAGFSPAEYGDTELRQMMCVGTTESLKRHGAVNVDQTAVWGHVESVLRGSGAASPTRAYHAAYDKSHEQLAEYESRLQYPADAAGLAVVVNGTIREIELFDKPATLQKLWPRLVRSHALSSLWRRETPGRCKDAMSFLNEAVRAEWDQFASVGVGHTLRLTTKEAVGAALFCDDRIVHLSLFATGRLPESHGLTTPRTAQ
jgi:hypothetical protein